MPPGDELRRFLHILAMLQRWSSPGVIASTLGVDRATVHRILRGIHEEVGLARRRRGHLVEYRMMTPRERAKVDRERAAR